MTQATLLTGDALTVLRTLPDGVARCCVTSPPYFGLRDYGVEGQIGLEHTPGAYVARMVEVFREVRRALADDGTLWLNIGDSYAANRGYQVRDSLHVDVGNTMGATVPPGCKPKDLLGIPWLLAFALRADGWWLRSDIIWSKPNPMPESVTDRPTKSHEQVFLLSKRASYYYDAAAIAEKAVEPELFAGSRGRWTAKTGANGDRNDGGRGNVPNLSGTRNARTVWEIATQPYSGAHFAVFPVELARRCIVAGSAPGDTVLDPFSGSGTTAAVAVGNGRGAIGIELNPKYQELARQRIGPLLVA